MKNGYKESKIGLTFGFTLLAIFVLFPYFMWYKTAQIVNAKNKDYIELKNQVDYADKLLKNMEDVIKENQDLAIAKNEYVGKYCSKVDFNTQDCKDYIKATTKATINQTARDDEIAEEMFKMLEKH